jgi:hypothetical protein
MNTSARSHRRSLALALVLPFAVVAACDDGSTQDDDSAADGDDPSDGDDTGDDARSWELVDLDDAPGGNDGAAWAAAWWRWAMAQPATGHPLLAGADACADQDGPVAFLGSLAALSDGTGPDPIAHRCTIAEGTLVLLPVVNTTADNGAMVGPTWEDDDALSARAAGFVDGMDVLVLDVDGDKIVSAALEPLRIGPYRGDYRVADDDGVPALFGHPAVSGDVDPSFGDGVYAMIRLSAGTHTITTAALDVRDPADPHDDFASTATYTIVVE